MVRRHESPTVDDKVGDVPNFMFCQLLRNDVLIYWEYTSCCIPTIQVYSTCRAFHSDVCPDHAILGHVVSEGPLHFFQKNTFLNLLSSSWDEKKKNFVLKSYLYTDKKN